MSAYEFYSLQVYWPFRVTCFLTLPAAAPHHSAPLPAQILDALCVLREASIIHCDLKPENILLCPGGGGQLKLIDFGSACFQGRTVYTYIQSRFYRSPEVVLGASYSTAIDMWSFGCVAAEMFLGLPLFPGASEHDLLGRILETLGPLPPHLLGAGKHTSKFFRRTQQPGSAAAVPGGATTGAAGSSSIDAAAETAAALAAADSATPAAAAAASGPHSVVCQDAAGVSYTLRDKDNFEAVNRVAVSQPAVTGFDVCLAKRVCGICSQFLTAAR
jgi:hypothetical protein